MRNLFYLAILFSIAVTGCSGDAPATEELPEAEPALTVDSPTFGPLAEELENGTPVARVGGMLMQRFPEISDPNTGLLNEDLSREFVYLAVALADRYPKDTLAALPLYRAAEVVRALNDPKRAAVLYERVHDEYTGFSKAPESLFMAAFTHDEDLNDLDRARETYERFLKLYPNNVFAESTPMLLENLGKSDEEMLRELEEKAQQ